MNNSTVVEETWEARCERREREEERRAALAYVESVRAAYADPDAPPLAPESVIRLAGATVSTGEEPPGALGLLLSSLITGSLDFVNLIPLLNVPLDTMVTGSAGTDGADNYQASYVDEAGRVVTIDLGADRVLAEWAEGILAERRWRVSPSARRWQHPRPSDLI